MEVIVTTTDDARLLNTIEAAALQAIREYYGMHAGCRRGPFQCRTCRKARTFASLIGVDLDKEE